MKKIMIHDLLSMKRTKEKIACLTAYDYSQAQLMNQYPMDVILVGDSLGMVIQGHASTVPVSMFDMLYHTRCVHRGCAHSFLIADMPYMTYTTPSQAITNAGQLMQSGADMVKLEGGAWLAESIGYLCERGIPTCAHLGLTPQYISMIGGFKVQGRDQQRAAQLFEDALVLVQSGVGALLLECVPSTLAKDITQAVDVPVIGIGAGSDTDGQILVFYDMVGLATGKQPKFVKNFMEEAHSLGEAIEHYVRAVKEGRYPDVAHSYS